MRRFRFELALLSRHRQFLYGFAALWIVLFHCIFSLPEGEPLAPLRWFKDRGNCGVDIFALLSGMGLYRSMKKDERVLPFYGRRISKVFLPTFLVAALFYGIQFTGTGQYILKLMIMPFLAGVGFYWYVPFILLMYLLYPLVYRLQKRSEKLLWIPLLASLLLPSVLLAVVPGWTQHCERLLTRIPVFLIGCMLAPKIDRKESVSLWWMPLALAAYIPLEFVRIWPLNRYAYALMSVFLVMGLSLSAQLLIRGASGRLVYRMTAFMGGISLEMYLLHTRLRDYIAMTDAYAAGGDSLFKLELVSVIAAIAASVLLQHLCDLLIHRFREIRIPDEK